MRSLIAFGTALLMFAASAPLPAVQLSARTALFLSGTQACVTAPGTCTLLSVPTPEQMAVTLPEVFRTDDPVGVPIPGQFRPFTGGNSLTWDESVAEGTRRVLAAIRSTPGTKAVFGISQSATIVAEVKRELLDDPARPPASELSFVVEGNPNRPNGGIAARFPGLAVPFLGVTSTGAAPDTPYDTIDVARQYDPIADFPKYPLNLIATANALAGFFYLHLHYDDVDLATVPRRNVQEVVNSQGGTTTYYLVPTPNLPLLQPLRDFGVPASIVDPLNTALTPIVEAGYDRRPNRVGVPTPAQLVPSPADLRDDTPAEEISDESESDDRISRSGEDGDRPAGDHADDDVSQAPSESDNAVSR